MVWLIKLNSIATYLTVINGSRDRRFGEKHSSLKPIVWVMDEGNYIIKAKIARRESGEITFPHALMLLSDTEFRTKF